MAYADLQVEGERPLEEVLEGPCHAVLLAQPPAQAGGVPALLAQPARGAADVALSCAQRRYALNAAGDGRGLLSVVLSDQELVAVEGGERMEEALEEAAQLFGAQREGEAVLLRPELAQMERRPGEESSKVAMMG